MKTTLVMKTTHRRPVYVHASQNFSLRAYALRLLQRLAAAMGRALELPVGTRQAAQALHALVAIVVSLAAIDISLYAWLAATAWAALAVAGTMQSLFSLEKGR